MPYQIPCVHIDHAVLDRRLNHARNVILTRIGDTESSLADVDLDYPRRKIACAESRYTHSPAPLTV